MQSPEERRQKHRDACRRWRSNPENRQKAKQYNQAYRLRPEVKQHNIEYGKQKRSQPGYKEKRNELDRRRRSRPEIKQKIAVYDRKRRALPEIKQKIIAWRREFSQRPENKEKHRERMRNRHGQKRANGGNVSPTEWQRIKLAYGNQCVYCGRKLKQLTQDHVIPISKGGKHLPENIVPACRACNSRKRDKEAPPFQRAMVELFVNS